MTIFNFLTLLGSLSLFLFGMSVMGTALEKRAGGSLKAILAKLTNGKFSGLLTGLAVTAVIQSSSATTVMVVGFVNAGLLNLEQSIGIICGAHIGTTVTGQLVAFNIGVIVYPAIIAGLLLGLAKNRLVAHWGEVIIGFGFLFLGMELMNGTLKDLEFLKTAIKYFDCAPDASGVMPVGSVFGAILVGMLVTVIIQSSSACTGLIIIIG